MSAKSFKRGELQAIVANAMVRNNIRTNSTPKPEVKTKAAEEAMKALGDKNTRRSLQILNYLLRNGYRPTEVASRLEDYKPAKKAKAAKKSAKKAPAAASQVAMAA